MRDLVGAAIERAQQGLLLGGAVIYHLRADLVALDRAVHEVKIISSHARERLAQTMVPAVAAIVCRSNASKQHEHDNDDQDRAKQADAAISKAIAVAAKSPAEPAEQEDDQDDNKYRSE
jgi:hypothetical protein